MASNFKGKGDVIELTAGGTIAVNDVILENELVGVALTAAVSGETYRVGLAGVFELPSDTGITIDAGDRVFWDPGNGWVDKTAAAQQYVGVAFETKLSATPQIDVKLGGNAPVPVAT
jgi:predicted RecA/RadA family phage recombinase